MYSLTDFQVHAILRSPRKDGRNQYLYRKLRHYSIQIMNKFTILFLLIICSIPFLFCQENVVDTVYLGNASFEGIPGGNRVPQNWADCGPEDMSPPDIHPTGIWQVWTPSYDGYTYIGMVARGKQHMGICQSEIAEHSFKRQLLFLFYLYV